MSVELEIDLGDMYAEAIGMLPALWRKAVEEGRDPHKLALDLTDSAGTLLLSVPFVELLAQRDKLH